MTIQCSSFYLRVIRKTGSREVNPHGKIFLKDKILLDTDPKRILLAHQNNFAGTLKIMSNAAKNFDILATGLSILRNYFVQNYFSDLYPAKILNLSKFFSCNIYKN